MSFTITQNHLLYALAAIMIILVSAGTIWNFRSVSRAKRICGENKIDHIATHNLLQKVLDEDRAKDMTLHAFRDEFRQIMDNVRGGFRHDLSKHLSLMDLPASLASVMTTNTDRNMEILEVMLNKLSRKNESLRELVDANGGRANASSQQMQDALKSETTEIKRHFDNAELEYSEEELDRFCAKIKPMLEEGLSREDFKLAVQKATEDNQDVYEAVEELTKMVKPHCCSDEEIETYKERNRIAREQREDILKRLSNIATVVSVVRDRVSEVHEHVEEACDYAGEARERIKEVQETIKPHCVKRDEMASRLKVAREQREAMLKLLATIELQTRTKHDECNHDECKYCGCEHDECKYCGCNAGTGHLSSCSLKKVLDKPDLQGWLDRVEQLEKIILVAYDVVKSHRKSDYGERDNDINVLSERLEDAETTQKWRA